MDLILHEPKVQYVFIIMDNFFKQHKKPFYFHERSLEGCKSLPCIFLGYCRQFMVGLRTPSSYSSSQSSRVVNSTSQLNSKSSSL